MERIRRACLVATVLAGTGCPTPVHPPPDVEPPSPRVRDPNAPVAQRALDVGDKAPLFELPVASGGTWSLANALEKGRAVLVFYQGDWCPYCRTQLGQLQDMRTEFAERGVELVAISHDPPAVSMALAERLEIELPMLSDGDLTVIEQYWVKDPSNDQAWPSIFIVDRDATIAWRLLVEQLRVRPGPEVILEALETLEHPPEPPSR